MLKFYTFIFAIVFSNVLIAQKTLEKSFDAVSVNEIIINGNKMFKISVETASVQTISLKAVVQGETFENLLITEKQELNKLTFGLAYAPFFKPKNDKLAAHKVIAVELLLIIPEGKLVTVTSDLASFTGEGNYKSLNVSLAQGSCRVTNFKGNGIFHTLIGDIFIEAHPEVSGTARSESGTITNMLLSHQKYDLFAQSKHGNIYLTQTE